MEAFLDALAWRDAPWTASHEGADLYAALHLAGEIGSEWEIGHIRLALARVRSRDGLSGGAAPSPVDRMRCHCSSHTSPARSTTCSTASTLASAPVSGRARRYLSAHLGAARLPARGAPVGFAEVDWVYCLHRAARAAGRLEEARRALADFAAEYVAFLMGLDADRHPGLDDPCTRSSVRSRRSRSCSTGASRRDRERFPPAARLCSTAGPWPPVIDLSPDGPDRLTRIAAPGQAAVELDE